MTCYPHAQVRRMDSDWVIESHIILGDTGIGVGCTACIAQFCRR